MTLVGFTFDTGMVVIVRMSCCTSFRKDDFRIDTSNDVLVVVWNANTVAAAVVVVI